MSYFEAGDWKSIKSFMIQRSKLPECQGALGRTGPESSRWYTLRDDSIVSNMTVCEICYEDMIAWNDLEKYFTTLPSTMSTVGNCTCDAAVPLIRNGFKLYAASTEKDDEWNTLLPWVRRRMELPACKETKQLEAGRTDWYGLQTVPELIICGACYLDTFGLDYGDRWNSLSLTNEQKTIRLECAMLTGPIQMAWQCFKAKSVHDFQEFEDHAKTIMESPRCDPEGIKNATWFTPSTYRGNQFAICGRCIAAFMIPPGFHSQFRRLSPPDDGSAYVCDFSPVKPRFATYMAKYDEAVAQNDLQILSSFVSQYAALPDCPKSTAVPGRKWYGTEDFTVCELCFEDFVKNTNLASRLESETVAGEVQCHLYSPRMRKLWLQACEENDLVSFGALARQRMEILQYVQRGKTNIRLMQSRRREQQSSLFMSSLSNQGIEGMSIAIGQRSTYNYGNSEIGWNYNTWCGAEGASQFRQALSINVFRPEDIMEEARLTKMWAEVE